MASRRAPRSQRAAPRDPVQAFLLRRGIEVKLTEPDLPFPKRFGLARQERVAERLGSYAFRLFLRGAILHPEGFTPAEATQFLEPEQARELAAELVELGLARRLARGRYRLVRPARSFGGTLEWYVARELRRRLGFEVATALAWRARGVGGDLDVVALADGRLAYLELKSGPPKHLSTGEVSSWLDRVRALRPDVAMLVLDTSLRLSDKVLPMLAAELERRGSVLGPPRRVVRELWALNPHLYAANAKWDLVANLVQGIAEGLRALAPEPP